MSSLRNIFTLTTRSVTTAALLIGTLALVSRLLGVIRVRIFADIFGAGPELDMFYAAFRLPDLIFNIMIMGAVTSAFIPVFTEYRVRHRDYWRLASVTLSMFLVSLAVMAGVLMLLAPLLIGLIAPGFTAEEQRFTVTLTRIMLIQPVLLGVSNIFSGILQSLKRFVSYASAPVMYNLGIIIGALTLTRSLGITGLAWSVLLGAVLHLLIQLPALKGTGFRLRPIWSFFDQGFRRIIRLMIPRSLGLAAIQVNILVTTAIASTLAAGSIAIFNFANDIQYVPLGIIGIAYAIATFPTLTENAAQRDQAVFKLSLLKSLREIIFLTLPLALIFFVLRDEIVTTIFATRKCGSGCLSLTAGSLALFAVSIVFQGLIPLLSKAFYALKDTLTPVVLNVISIGVNIGAALGLTALVKNNPAVSRFLGDVFDSAASPATLAVLALPLAFSAAAAINFILLGLALKHRLRGQAPAHGLYRAFLKMLLGGTVLIAVTLLARKILMPAFDVSRSPGALGLGLIAGGAGLLAYLAAAAILNLREGRELVGKVLNIGKG